MEDHKRYSVRTDGPDGSQYYYVDTPNEAVDGLKTTNVGHVCVAAYEPNGEIIGVIYRDTMTDSIRDGLSPDKLRQIGSLPNGAYYYRLIEPTKGGRIVSVLEARRALRSCVF